MTNHYEDHENDATQKPPGPAPTKMSTGDRILREIERRFGTELYFRELDLVFYKLFLEEEHRKWLTELLQKHKTS